MSQTEMPLKAVHSWSLFRTLGRYVAPGSMPGGALPEQDGGDVALLGLPSALAEHGYRSVQLCHFYLPQRTDAYLDELRHAFEAAGVVIEALLIDDGDLTHPTDADAAVAWIGDWLGVAERLGATRARVIAGRQSPTPQRLAAGAARLVDLADRHPGVRLVTENWHALLPDAEATNALLDATGDRVGFLIDLGNWSGPDKFDQLAAVARRAETCQAKVTVDARGAIDVDDYRSGLTVLRDAGYAGPLALVYDGPDPDEWGHLERAWELVGDVFGPGPG